MTLTIQTEENESRELKLTIEVPEDRVEQAMRQTARKLSRDIHIPGFRRGKVPYNVILNRVGRKALRSEAIDEIVQGVFEEALEQVEPEVYGRSSFDDMEMEPLVLKFTVPLTPKVNLGDYRELRKEIEPVNVTDDAVEEALEQVQIRHQQIEPVDRPAEEGDLVTISGNGELVQVEDEESDTESENIPDNFEDVIFDEENFDLLLDGEKLYLGQAFVDNIVGMSAGDEKSFTIKFPDDHQDEELAGKEADFEITVLDVKKRELPALDDELAKLEGDHETLNDLRSTIRERLEEQAENEARNQLIEDMITDMLAGAEITYPQAAIDVEIDDMVRSFKDQVKRSGWEWDDFLRLQNNSEEDIRENFRDSAVERLERQQVLRQFILNEKLTVSAEDVDMTIEKRLEPFGDNDELMENMRNYFQSKYGHDMISSEIIMDKVYERMQAILSGNAPDLDAIESAAASIDEEE